MVSKAKDETPEQKARRRERQRAWHKAHPGYNREWQRRWAEAHPEVQKMHRTRWRERRRLARETSADKPRTLICEVCSAVGKTVFDHCHDCGEFRGWLCDGCNTTLGRVRDDPAWLDRLAAYLRDHLAVEAHVA
jgi:hypothetical protein